MGQQHLLHEPLAALVGPVTVGIPLERQAVRPSEVQPDAQLLAGGDRHRSEMATEESAVAAGQGHRQVEIGRRVAGDLQ